MLFDDLLNEYLEKYPIHKVLNYCSDDRPVADTLPLLLLANQAVVNSMLEIGKNRIAIVLPDDELNILPLLVAFYFEKVKYDPDYSGNIFDDIESGQHIRIGDAVAEFIRLNKDDNTIVIKYGTNTSRSTPVELTAPASEYRFYMEKTDSALSSISTWNRSITKLKQRVKTFDKNDVRILKGKRSTLNKTIMFLAGKGTFVNDIKSLRVCEESLDKIITYGEVDNDIDGGHRLLNRGQLDCKPAISVASKLHEIRKALRNPEVLTSTSTIVVSQEKYSEIVDNIDTLKKCLKAGIPFIVFVPEREYESYKVLDDLKFSLWHWDTSLLKASDAFYNNDPVSGSSIFYEFSQKINSAIKSSVSVAICDSDMLALMRNKIRVISNALKEENSDLHRLVMQAYKFHRILSNFVHPGNETILEKMNEALIEMEELWNKNKDALYGREVYEEVNHVLELAKALLHSGKNGKATAMQDFLEDRKTQPTVVLFPDRFDLIDDYRTLLQEQYNVDVYNLNEFLAESRKYNYHIENVVVTWFSASDFLLIKQTYCYDTLHLILYKFEDNWRKIFNYQYDTGFATEAIVERTKEIGITLDETVETDVIESHIFEEYDEHNFENDVIKEMICTESTSSEAADSVETIPILLSPEAVAFFSPNHELIDVTSLCMGRTSLSEKKDAAKLNRGDLILIRQSSRDIVYEKADELLQKDKMIDLRSLSSKWVERLERYSSGKEAVEVMDAFAEKGVECSIQQIRYWLLGDTICPSDKNVLIAIAELCCDEEFLASVDEVYAAGKTVQEYHRKAGRLISRELKSRAGEIADIYKSANRSGNVEGIGNVQIFRVEDILEREYVNRVRVNRVEEV